MANGHLSKKFLFGANNSLIYMPATPEYDFFIGIPERQKKLVKLAQAQVAAQHEISKSIESSNSKIANEIKQFSAELGGAITNLSANITQVGDTIVSAIDSLEYSIICEFREVRWLLSQVGDHLEEIINILKNKRKFEANELLEQALSNLNNGYYKEAKDRLLKAIEFDNTDYQIHRNLGFVFLHDDNADKAIEHFQKTVAFSPNNKCKIDALADLSRSYYAIDNYSKALEHLDELLEILNQKRNIVNEDEFARILYNYSVYSGLIGDTDTCLKNLDQSIKLRRNYFVLATIDQDFKNIRNYINKFLTDTVELASQAAESNCRPLFILVEDLSKNVKNYESSYLDEVYKNINIVKLKLENPSYTDLIDIKVNSLVLTNIMKLIKNEKELQEELEATEKDLSKEEKRLNEFEEKEKDEIKRLEIKERKGAESRKFRATFLRGIIVIISFGALAIIAFLFFSASWKGCMQHLDERPPQGFFAAIGNLISTILWGIFNLALVPVSLVAPFWVSSKILDSMKEYVSEAGMIKKVDYIRPTEHEGLITSASNKRSKVSNLMQKLHNLKSKITNYLNEINWTVK